MGDPETQVVIPLLNSSLFALLDDCLSGCVNKTVLEISHQTAVTVVLAANGYPNSYKKGMKISGINDENTNFIFHAGTSMVNNEVVTSGGRVINVVGFGENLKQAIDEAYKLANQIEFEDKFFRGDIGQKGLSYK
jgi:phosphoribosylamine-glycine ligase